jgi:hypothetical protein
MPIVKNSLITQDWVFISQKILTDLDSAGQRHLYEKNIRQKALCTLLKTAQKCTLLILRFCVKIRPKRWNSKKPNGAFAESLIKIG